MVSSFANGDFDLANLEMIGVDHPHLKYTEQLSKGLVIIASISNTENLPTSWFENLKRYILQSRSANIRDVIVIVDIPANYLHMKYDFSALTSFSHSFKESHGVEVLLTSEGIEIDPRFRFQYDVVDEYVSFDGTLQSFCITCPPVPESLEIMRRVRILNRTSKSSSVIFRENSLYNQLLYIGLGFLNERRRNGSKIPFQILFLDDTVMTSADLIFLQNSNHQNYDLVCADNSEGFRHDFAAYELEKFGPSTSSLNPQKLFQPFQMQDWGVRNSMTAIRYSQILLPHEEPSEAVQNLLKNEPSASFNRLLRENRENGSENPELDSEKLASISLVPVFSCWGAAVLADLDLIADTKLRFRVGDYANGEILMPTKLLFVSDLLVLGALRRGEDRGRVFVNTLVDGSRRQWGKRPVSEGNLATGVENHNALFESEDKHIYMEIVSKKHIPFVHDHDSPRIPRKILSPFNQRRDLGHIFGRNLILCLTSTSNNLLTDEERKEICTPLSVKESIKHLDILIESDRKKKSHNKIKT